MSRPPKPAMVAGLEKRPLDIAGMFDSVAGRYDLLNDVLSLGQDRRWRRLVGRTVGAAAGELVLDLAAGTGTSSRALISQDAACVACDFSVGMLAVGSRKLRARATPAPGAAGTGKVRFVAGDALCLPFADGVFDAVTISFGLRNIADVPAALAEMRRVTRPGGRLVICEFGHLRSRALDALYDRALAVMLPAVARTLSRAPAAYRYLAESIRQWPDARQLAELISAAGWSAVSWRELTLGVVALHRARNQLTADRPIAGKV